ncbi:YbaK/EbsC family protein [Spirillospora sp. NPDC052269]
MITRSDITGALDAAGIPFSLVEHPEARTTEEADAFIEGLEGVRTKSLFLVNRRRTAAYLLIMDNEKELDLGALAALLEETRLSFGSPGQLAGALGLEPGVVSPFGLIDPDHRAVTLLLDGEMLAEKTLTFHPGDNRATLFIGTEDLLAFLRDLGIPYRTIDL